MANARMHSLSCYHRLPLAALMLAGAVLLLCLFYASSAAAYVDPGYTYGVDWDPDTGTGSGSAVTSGAIDLVVSNTYQCHADGTTSGVLFVNPRCDASRGLFGVFANVICRVENLFGTVMGLVYCGVQNAVLNPLLALLTLYVTVYGAMVILGMVPHSFTEAIVRIVKIGIVAAIALNAQIAIGVGYTFFISMLQMSVQVVFDVFTPDFVTGTESVQDLIQAGYVSSPVNPDESKRLYLGDNWMQNLDYTTHRVLGFFMQAGIGFVIVMVGLLIFMPPLFLIIVYLILSIFKAFAAAIIGYLLALIGITFLFTLSPIFVSMALFRTTAGWFDTWLRHLFSYTLQIMVIFVFLMFLVMIDLVSFFQQIGGLVRTYEHIFAFGWLMKPVTVFTFCRVRRTDGLTGEINYYKFNVDGTESTALGSQYEGFPRCMPEYELREVLEGNMGYRSPYAALPPGLGENREQMDALMEAIDDGVELPYDAGADMPSGLETVSEIFNKANDDLKLPFLELVTSTDLIFFLLVRFVTVIILTYLLQRFMTKVPHMASQLAGTGFAGRLGGGEYEPGDSAGVQNASDLSSIDTGFASFKQGMYGKGYYPRGFIRSAPARFAAGVSAGISGASRNAVQSSLNRGSRLGLRQDVRREVGQDQSILESQREGLFAPSRGGIGRQEGTYGAGGGGGRPSGRGGSGGRRSRGGI